MSFGGKGSPEDYEAKQRMEKFRSNADVSRAAHEAGYVSIPRRLWNRLLHRPGEPTRDQGSPSSGGE